MLRAKTRSTPRLLFHHHVCYRVKALVWPKEMWMECTSCCLYLASGCCYYSSWVGWVLSQHLWKRRRMHQAIHSSLAWKCYIAVAARVVPRQIEHVPYTYRAFETTCHTRLRFAEIYIEILHHAFDRDDSYGLYGYTLEIHMDVHLRVDMRAVVI